MNIFDNPFYKLGVSTRSTRSQITAAADDKALLDDPKAINEACSALIIPSKRLVSELRWFPGMQGDVVQGIVDFFQKLSAGRPTPKIETGSLRGIALLNFAAYMFRFRRFKSADEIITSLLAVDKCFEIVTPEVICAAINRDRRAAGFPLAEMSEVERELKNYRRDVVNVIDAKLAELPPEAYDELMRTLAERYSADDVKNLNLFITSDLLDDYALRIMHGLDEQKDLMREVIIDIQASEELYEKIFVQLSSHLKKWKELARPLLLTAKRRGTEHSRVQEQADDIMLMVRKLSLRLHNEYGKTKDALRFTLILSKYLDDVSPNISRTINDDIAALNSMIEAQDKAKAEYEQKQKQQHDEWAKSIYYETEMGLIFKDRLRISSEGILWKGTVTPLESITGIRWGAIRHFINGIPTGTEYKIAFQASFYQAEIRPNKKRYEEIIDHLWLAVGEAILTRMLQQLKNGDMITIGDIKLKDEGVYLTKHKWFSSDTQFFKWSRSLSIGSYNGSFIIHDQTEGAGYNAQASYINDMNTHILEVMLRLFFKRGRARLSSLLDS